MQKSDKDHISDDEIKKMATDLSLAWQGFIEEIISQHLVQPYMNSEDIGRSFFSFLGDGKTIWQNNHQSRYPSNPKANQRYKDQIDDTKFGNSASSDFVPSVNDGVTLQQLALRIERIERQISLLERQKKSKI